MPILETALGKKQSLPERKSDRIEEFRAMFAEVEEVIIDSTERPVQCPKDPERQKELYSGKKRYTRKDTTGSTRKKRIILLSKAKAGKVHDKKQLEEEDWVSNRLIQIGKMCSR
jgi:hypothetical protein